MGVMAPGKSTELRSDSMGSDSGTATFSAVSSPAVMIGTTWCLPSSTSGNVSKSVKSILSFFLLIVALFQSANIIIFAHPYNI